MPKATAMAGKSRFHAEARFDLPAGSFPFESRFVEVAGARLHYVDEGAGPCLVMLHGNPTWSFLYRRLIAALCDRYRCLAIDLAGMGLSDPPSGFSGLPQDQAGLVAAALRQLEIREATLIAHDWGGPIGIGAMLADPGRITRLVLGNTWAWPVNGDWHFEWFSRLMGGALGRWASERFCLFVNLMMPGSMRRRKLTRAEMQAYRAPFADRPRQAMHLLPKAILGSRDWLATLERGLRKFAGPVHLIWPDADIAFRHNELLRWQALLPQASVTLLANCGHYLWEDAPDEALAALLTALSHSSRAEPAPTEDP